jgi:hypothetical protein
VYKKVHNKDMVTVPQHHTSFIPKQSSPAVSKRGGGGMKFFVIIGSIVFGLSLASAASVYGYGYLLSRQIDQVRESLDHNRSTLSTKDIAEWKRLDDRMHVVEEILSRHLAFSRFFGLLEQHTLQSVRFSHFSYEFTREGEAEVSLSGIAPDYASVVSQSDILGMVEEVRDPIFSDLMLDDKGKVSFTVTATLNPELTRYDGENHI